ncbi:MAG: hypothetical protein Q8R15_03945 [Candidatus Micrarchaeota archaeon]|nr:hypothetical protein [Candidatus Micrarchaeota archaeon]
MKRIKKEKRAKKEKKEKTIKKKKVQKTKDMKKNKKLICECRQCGYKHIHLHGGKCPMCKQCPRCKEKLHSCKCIEGE